MTAHPYDEANMVVAERIYSDIRPVVEKSLEDVGREKQASTR